MAVEYNIPLVNGGYSVGVVGLLCWYVLRNDSSRRLAVVKNELHLS